MKKILKSLLFSCIVIQGVSYADGEKKGIDLSKYKVITVIDKGIERKIYIPLKQSVKQLDARSVSTTQLQAKEGVVIKFKDASLVDIQALEEKYQIHLKTKPIVGYYIFENQSKYMDIDLMSKIIENEKNILSIKPNWKTNMKPI